MATTALTVGDTSPDLTGTLTSAGTAVNITGATLALHIRKPSGTVLTKAGVIESGAAGTWSYTWQTGDLDEAGNWLVEVQVTYSSGRIQTFGPEPFPVIDAIA